MSASTFLSQQMSGMRLAAIEVEKVNHIKACGTMHLRNRATAGGVLQSAPRRWQSRYFSASCENR